MSVETENDRNDRTQLIRVAGYFFDSSFRRTLTSIFAKINCYRRARMYIETLQSRVVSYSVSDISQ